MNVVYLQEINRARTPQEVYDRLDKLWGSCRVLCPRYEMVPPSVWDDLLTVLIELRDLRGPGAA